MLQLEDDPHNTVALHVIGEFLYGNTAEDVSCIFYFFMNWFTVRLCV